VNVRFDYAYGSAQREGKQLKNYRHHDDGGYS
jgi:hypothetical protein